MKEKEEQPKVTKEIPSNQSGGKLIELEKEVCNYKNVKLFYNFLLILIINNHIFDQKNFNLKESDFKDSY